MRRARSFAAAELRRACATRRSVVKSARRQGTQSLCHVTLTVDDSFCPPPAVQYRLTRGHACRNARARRWSRRPRPGAPPLAAAAAPSRGLAARRGTTSRWFWSGVWWPPCGCRGWRARSSRRRRPRCSGRSRASTSKSVLVFVTRVVFVLVWACLCDLLTLL